MRIKSDEDKEREAKFVEDVERIGLLNLEIFKEKNKKYGNSFLDSLEEYGFLPLLIRLYEKNKRLEGLVYEYEENNNRDTEESILDTLLDISNYCLMGAGYYNIKEKNYWVKEKI